MDLFNLNVLFLWVLNQSIVASYVIVGVLLVRVLLKRAPKGFSYALWGVVLVRLLCPLSLETNVSVIPVSAQPIVSAAPADATAQGDDSANVEGTTQGSPQVDVQTNTAIANAANAATSTSSVTADVNANVHPNPLQIWLDVAGVVWLLGMACLLLYSIVSLLRLRSVLANALPLAPNAQSATLPASNIPCNVYHSTQVETAFVLGVLRPNIYLPAQLSRAEMQYILCHEQTHIHRGDHIFKLIAFLALCLHWFNPLVWVAFFLCGKDMELSCDERVLQTLGCGIKQEYSASLLSLATGKRILGGTPLAFGEGDTKSRIQNVLRYRKPTLWVSVLAVCVLLCAAVALLTTQKADLESTTSEAVQPASPMQTIAVQLGDPPALTQEAQPYTFALAQDIVQGAVDALNAAGETPAQGKPYYVTAATITGATPQSTGAATECFAVGTYLLEYEITLSTTEDITLPEGFQLACDAATAVTGAEAATVADSDSADADVTAQPFVCTPTAAAQPYLYTFGGAYDGAEQWQALGMLTYDEVDALYGGPSRLAVYGDCITASANELLGDCIANEVDFTQFAFAAPNGLPLAKPSV